MSPIKCKEETLYRPDETLTDKIQFPETLYFYYEDEKDVTEFNSIGSKYQNVLSLRILVRIQEAQNDLAMINTIPINDSNFETLKNQNNLENLQINTIPFHGNGLRFLSASKLKRLTVYRCPIHDVFFESMTSVPYLETLVVEDHFHTLTSPDLGYLQGCQDLRSCNFTKCYFTDNAFERFPELPSLEILMLEENDITCENFHFMKGFMQLKSLALTKTKLTAKGVEVISSNTLPKLERLTLMHCPANDEWASYLSKMQQLKVLLFNGGHFTDKCIADFQNMQNLEYLSFDSCDISEKACKAIHNACDKATVVLPNGNELESKKQKRIRRRYE